MSAEDPIQAARAWHARGGRVVGFVSNSIPVELIHAAGCFPLQLPPCAGQPTPLADRYMEASFDPMARSLLERLLRGDFAFVDLLVLPRTYDSFQRLYYYLCELRRTHGVRLPELFLYDLLHTPWYSSAQYNHARTAEFGQRLQALTGSPIGDQALCDSIALYNRVRSKLAALLSRRRALPCQLPATAALAILMRCETQLPAAVEAELDGWLQSPPAVAPGKRVVLVGSAHDDSVLHSLIARAGGQVIGDYHWRGELLLAGRVDPSRPALHALSRHYHRESFSARTFPTATEALREFVRDARAQAVIFYYYRHEEALTWDYPAQRRTLDELGVPSLCLRDQAYPAASSLHPTLSAFLSTTSASSTLTAAPDRSEVEAS